MNKNIAVIFAGGSGARMGSGLPKQFIEVDGKPIIIHTLEIFEEHPMIDAIYIACKEEYISKLERMTKMYMITKVQEIVPGGSTGQDSIYNGLKAAYDAEGGNNVVLIHDGVRPYIVPEVIDDNIKMVQDKGSAITCTPFFETPILSKGKELVEESPDRNDFFTAQAPQSFVLGDILKAHEETRKINPEYKGIVDSCTLMRSAGHDVYMVEGNRGNIKVTTPEDLYVFRAMLQYSENRQALGLSEKEIADQLHK